MWTAGCSDSVYRIYVWIASALDFVNKALVAFYALILDLHCGLQPPFLARCSTECAESR